jgi:hypothetical protein
MAARRCCREIGENGIGHALASPAAREVVRPISPCRCASAWMGGQAKTPALHAASAPRSLHSSHRQNVAYAAGWERVDAEVVEEGLHSCAEDLVPRWGTFRE